MQIPDEFYDFCLYLHQDSAEVYGPSVEAVIDGVTRRLRPEQRLVLQNYIRHLIAGGYSDNELAGIYRETDAELGFRNPGGLRRFLAMVCDQLDVLGFPGKGLFKTEIYGTGVVMTLTWYNEEEYRLGREFLTKLAGPAREIPNKSKNCYCLHSEEQFDKLLEFRNELRERRGLE